MFALRLDANIYRRTTTMFRRAYAARIALDNFFKMHRRISLLANIKPEVYHCCIDTCCAFTGDFSQLEECPYCAHPRYDVSGKPYKTFEYIPIIPRLLGLFHSPEMVREMSYRATRTHEAHQYADIFDGAYYQELTWTN